MGNQFGKSSNLKFDYREEEKIKASRKVLYDGVVLVPLKILGTHDCVVYSRDSKIGPFYNAVGEKIVGKPHPVTFNQKKVFDPARDHKGEIRYRNGKTFSIEIDENFHVSYKAGVFNINTFYHGFSEEVLFSLENEKNWLAAIVVIEEKLLSRHIFRDILDRFENLKRVNSKKGLALEELKNAAIIILKDLIDLAMDRYEQFPLAKSDPKFFILLDSMIEALDSVNHYDAFFKEMKKVLDLVGTNKIDESILTVSYYPCHPDELLKALENSTLSYLRFRPDSYEQLGDSVKLPLQTKTYLERKDGHPVQLAEHSAHVAIAPVKLDVCLRLTELLDKTDEFKQGSLNPLLAKFQSQSTIITQLIERGLSKSRAEHLVRGRSDYYDNLKLENFLTFFADNISDFDALYKEELAAIRALQKSFDHAIKNASEDSTVKESIAESLKNTQDEIFAEIFENLKQDHQCYDDHVTNY